VTWFRFRPAGTSLRAPTASGGAATSLRSAANLLLATLLLIAALLSACSGGSKTTPTSTAAAGTAEVRATAQPAPTSAPTAPKLSLVYVDRAAGPQQLKLAGMDGSNPRTVVTLPQGSRVLDLKLANVLVTGGGGLVVRNLVTNASTTVTTTGNVSFAKLLGDTAVVYAVPGGCGPPGPPKSTLMLADLRNASQKELASFPFGNLSIIGVDAASNIIAVAPRGCDVTTSEVDLVKIADGSKQTFAVQGCGWVEISGDFRRALASWLGCTRPAPHATADASAFDLASASPPGRDLQAPAGGSNQQPWLFRPGSQEAALGTAARIAGPGGTTSTGLWLLDVTTEQFQQIAPASGLEQYPVAWSPDGRYLLFASVQAQGVCSYAYVDMTSRAVKPVSPDITVCGINGELLGWAVLP
jgi:hypothetical protein